MANIMISACAKACPRRSAKACCATQDYEVYVRDRSPQAHFTGRNYVLPRIGPEGAPIVSVNTTKVKVKIFRVGDRNLLPTIRSEDFLAQLSRNAAETVRRQRRPEDLVRNARCRNPS